MTRLVVLIVAALALVGCGTTPTTAPTAGPTVATGALPLEVSVAEADELREAGALVLDVREPSEWATGHIEDATLIPLGELAARVDELPRDRDVVVVCRSGNRSAQGRDVLLAAGFLAVTSMAGGMTDWIASGLPVITPGA